MYIATRIITLNKKKEKSKGNFRGGGRDDVAPSNNRLADPVGDE